MALEVAILVARRTLVFGGAGLDQGTQPARQAGRRLPRGGVSLAGQEPMAQSDRAQMGPWQARDGGTGSEVECGRTKASDL